MGLHIGTLSRRCKTENQFVSHLVILRFSILQGRDNVPICRPTKISFSSKNLKYSNFLNLRLLSTYIWIMDSTNKSILLLLYVLHNITSVLTSIFRFSNSPNDFFPGIVLLNVLFGILTEDDKVRFVSRNLPQNKNITFV